MNFESTKIIELGSCAFRQWRAEDTHCKYIHGYQLKAKFWFKGELDDRNWVVNFGGLKELKNKLQEIFDHTLCVAEDDPLLHLFQELSRAGGCQLRVLLAVGIEKTAEYCFNIANEFVKHTTKDRCSVSKVEVWEHDLNSATYTAECAMAAINNDLPAPEPVQEETPHIMNKPLPVMEHQRDPNEPIPAKIGNNVTPGWSNLFGGTSWGA